MRRIALAFIGYLLGFLALSVFAWLAFGRGPVTDERLLQAFRIGALLAVVELAVLLQRPAPVNRLILGANLWLLAGGLAAWLQQWWWLQACQRLGEASLFAVMAAVGLATTLLSPAGFVGVPGPHRAVRAASLGLLAAVGLAIVAAAHFRGDVRWAAVVPVIALSWLQRLLARLVRPAV